MGLQPLEFSDCLTDSPYFREKLHTHEKELERTNKAIKGLISECKDLLDAAKSLSKAQRTLSQSLIKFEFRCIGTDQTDDEIVISGALRRLGELFHEIEDARDLLLKQAQTEILEPLEDFRKTQIGGAKDGKKKFDRQTAKFCQSLDRYLNLKAKSGKDQLDEADAAVAMERRHFFEASMQYVLLLQEVQERKKFDFVETLLRFVMLWLTFYHQSYDVSENAKGDMNELSLKLQKCRDSFDITRKEAEILKRKMLEVRGMKSPDQQVGPHTREGYLFLMEKKALGTTWNKVYCLYQKDNRIFTMIPYNQMTVKGVQGISTDTAVLTSCTRRATESIDKRFCFDIKVQDRSSPLTFQSLSEEDRRLWLDAMDGREPVYNEPSRPNEPNTTSLDDVGFNFLKKCIQCVEKRGLDEDGLYRVVGVASRVNKLTCIGLDKKKFDKLDLDDPRDYDIKTVTSALKNYLRSLPEPLMTFELYQPLITAAKKESRTLRINGVHELVHKLRDHNFETLEYLIAHLKRVANMSDQNRMTIANLGVCFGPTLMRAKEESMAAIMEIKWCNLVVEILVEYHEQIFEMKPDGIDISRLRTTDRPIAPVRPAAPPNFPPATPPAINSVDKSHSRPVSHHPNAKPATSHEYDDWQTPSTAVNSREMMREERSEFIAGRDPPGMSHGATGFSSQIPHGTAHAIPPAPQETFGQHVGNRKKSMGLYYNQSHCSVWNSGIFSSIDQPSSTSSSTDSLTSKSSLPLTSSPASAGGDQRKPAHTQQHGHVAQVAPDAEILEYDGSPWVAKAINRFSQAGPPSNTGGQPPTGNNVPSSGRFEPGINTSSFPFYRKRRSADSITYSIGSSASSISSISSNPGGVRGKKARTLYMCEGENETELSFEPNEIIENVRQSREPGWLEGTLNGRTGLLPVNYVEFL